MGLAAVSNLGRFRSRQGVIRTPQPTAGMQYAQVQLGGISFLLHVLVNVAHNRAGFSTDRTLTEHINHIKADNRAANLRFGSLKSNNEAAIANGRRSHAAQTSRPVLAVKGGEVKRFNNGREAGDALGVSATNITGVLKGRRKTAGGYSLSYAPQPDLPGEVWRQVPGLPDGCKVSSMNRFQLSLGHRVEPRIKNNGYRSVTVSGEVFLFHRLVALAFLENDSPSTKIEVDHLNMDRGDCRPENLEWVTPAENKEALPPEEQQEEELSASHKQAGKGEAPGWHHCGSVWFGQRGCTRAVPGSGAR